MTSTVPTMPIEDLQQKPIVAFQVDPLPSLNPITDTSLLLAKEAMRRGFSCFAYTPAALVYDSNGIYAHGVFFKVNQDNAVTETSQTQRLCLSEADYLLIRQNPPYDMTYISCLEILLRLPKSTRVLNCPKTLRLFSEKSIPLYFPDCSPRTCITQDPHVIKQFLSEEGTIVLKPLYGFGGLDVFILTPDDMNRDALIDMMCQRYPYGVIVQTFLQDVHHNERRLIFINGELKSVFKRIPQNRSIRSNTAVGGTAVACLTSDDDYKLAERLGPFLMEHNIMLCGVDAIGPHLIEVNITSPTGLRYAEALYNTRLEKDFWDAVLGDGR